MSATVSRFPEQTRPREIRLREIQRLAGELINLEAKEADADGRAVAQTIKDLAADRVRVLEKKS